MTEERRISEDELVEISGGADGPIIDIEGWRSRHGEDTEFNPSEPNRPGEAPTTEFDGGGGDRT